MSNITDLELILTNVSKQPKNFEVLCTPLGLFGLKKKTWKTVVKIIKKPQNVTTKIHKKR